jgi:murein DD-endopeptidase MepM/ murein hydrolase activator NlpD
MRRRIPLGLLLVLCLVAAGPAGGGGDIGTRKQAVDSKIGELQSRIERAKARERVLTSEIAAVTSEIRVLQDDVDSAQSQLAKLESVLALQQAKLDRLTELFRVQTERLVFLQGQYEIAVQRLSRRVVALYTGEQPDAMSVVLGAQSLTELIDQIEYLNDVGRQDQRIADKVERAKIDMRETREHTKRTRARVASTTRVIADRTAEQRSVRDRLVASRDQLAAARSLKNEALGAVRHDKEAYLHEVQALLAQSAALAARIRAAQAAAAPPPGAPVASSASGFMWPVNGVLTSGFGWRWGRMHEGIDIAAPTGSPVVASAAGTVIYAGWMGGYGNLVVIDHGGGLATAYGHNSGFAVGGGQSVAQGQVIAYCGSTGHSTGPHVHFEVRINGSPVDPLGYL